ncbi:hypothetical protein CVT26_011348 [Gymnopilus dilepis]|uniref:Uncharacterized protein n=1 Tax=Gymnopilus dilepis TaxID=231916 RepID=A0A409YHD3_9AGAR|nr:hypothetical protein CVT26_011348 [Gymnopilus dilepis]
MGKEKGLRCGRRVNIFVAANQLNTLGAKRAIQPQPPKEGTRFHLLPAFASMEGRALSRHAKAPAKTPTPDSVLQTRDAGLSAMTAVPQASILNSRIARGGVAATLMASAGGSGVLQPATIPARPHERAGSKAQLGVTPSRQPTPSAWCDKRRGVGSGDGGDDDGR